LVIGIRLSTQNRIQIVVIFSLVYKCTCAFVFHLPNISHNTTYAFVFECYIPISFIFYPYLYCIYYLYLFSSWYLDGLLYMTVNRYGRCIHFQYLVYAIPIIIYYKFKGCKFKIKYKNLNVNLIMSNYD